MLARRMNLTASLPAAAAAVALSELLLRCGVGVVLLEIYKMEKSMVKTPSKDVSWFLFYPVSLPALRRQLGGQDIVLVVVQIRAAPLLVAVFVVADVEPVLVVPPPAAAGGGDVGARRRARGGVSRVWKSPDTL